MKPLKLKKNFSDISQILQYNNRNYLKPHHFMSIKPWGELNNGTSQGKLNEGVGKSMVQKYR